MGLSRRGGASGVGCSFGIFITLFCIAPGFGREYSFLPKRGSRVSTRKRENTTLEAAGDRIKNKEVDLGRVLLRGGRPPLRGRRPLRDRRDYRYPCLRLQPRRLRASLQRARRGVFG